MSTLFREDLLEIAEEEGLERAFTGVFIPAEIWLDWTLGSTERILLAEINSLDQGNGCYASNRYLAGWCSLSESRLASLLSELRSKGYLLTTVIDGKRHLKVCMKPSEGLPKSAIPLAKTGNSDLPKLATDILDDKVVDSNSYSVQFDEIWSNLPTEYKRGKKKAWDAYKKAKLNDMDKERLAYYFRQYPVTQKLLERAGVFCPLMQDPERVIKHRRFDDPLPDPDNPALKPRSFNSEAVRRSEGVNNSTPETSDDLPALDCHMCGAEVEGKWFLVIDGVRYCRACHHKHFPPEEVAQP